MQPRIVSLTEKWLVGLKVNMSYATDQTPALWRCFMPQRNCIDNRLGNDLYSVQCYPEHFFDTYQPDVIFEKWATVAVAAKTNRIPEGMVCLNIPAGTYAVFDHKGPHTDLSVFEYIFKEWLPHHASYTLDARPHFEVLGAKYKNGDPDSEEEIWIPVKPK
ncbi:GyrI-like domain-containing protein [Taibaiella sp. KBW10]|uniref:GyrI-like domain-containing protein n=1 Tax=Taibaiella sp. KBW10 TaxID=2153357 RepID=UPI000F594DC5|nr:GyrI-like domain-containing protein [Taibaiella sp. KBW10]RQO32345.1 GyrI-like domain-containing protein [Taibaiella sp. KBW10]